MPVWLMEAAACGVPLVATAVGGIPVLTQSLPSTNHALTASATSDHDPGSPRLAGQAGASCAWPEPDRLWLGPLNADAVSF